MSAPLPFRGNMVLFIWGNMVLFFCLFKLLVHAPVALNKLLHLNCVKNVFRDLSCSARFSFQLSCFSLRNTGRNWLSYTNPNLLFDTNVFEFNCKMTKFKKIAIKFTFRVQLIYCDENSHCYLVHPLPPSGD